MLKPIFALLSILFLGSCYLGYYFAELYPEKAREELELLEEFFEPLVSASPIEIFFLIFLNNTIKSFSAMVLGAFLGIVPIVFIFLNGFLIGIFASLVGKKIGILNFILLLSPHGILEIPAVILACSYGVRLGILLLRDRKGFWGHLKKSVEKFFKIVAPMLFIAAVIETSLIALT